MDFGAGMHDFAVEWTASADGRPALMRWLVDGDEYYRRNLNASFGANPPYTQPGQPWDQPFHLILNLAVGGGFFPSTMFGDFSGPAQVCGVGSCCSTGRSPTLGCHPGGWP